MQTTTERSRMFGLRSSRLLVPCLGRALAGLALIALAGQTQAWQIDGLQPFSPATGTMTKPVVVEGRLHIAVSGNAHLTIGPWPDFLPARFGTQFVQSSRAMQPGGPEDRISFTHGRRGKPWLLIGDGSRMSSEIVGGWRLARSATGWALERDGDRRVLGTRPDDAHPVTVQAHGARWCVRLLESTIPQQRPGIALEEEARAGWVAVRLHGRLQSC